MKFIYIDESGIPKPNKTSNYFVLSGLSIDSNHILAMEQYLQKIKEGVGISPELEFKWTDSYKDFCLSFQQMSDYRKNVFDIIRSIGNTISVVINTNEVIYIKDHVRLYNIAFELLMERVHLDLEGYKDPVIFIVDSRRTNKEGKLDKQLADAYRRVLRDGTYFLKRFPFFLGTLFFSPSEDCAGLQLADYVAGAIGQLFNTGKREWYEEVKPSIQTKEGKIHGIGIKQFPHINQDIKL